MTGTTMALASPITAATPTRGVANKACNGPP
jgi:hypothetical protein